MQQRMIILIVLVVTGVTILAGRLYYSDRLATTAEEAQMELASSAGIDAEELESTMENEVVENNEIMEDEEVQSSSEYSEEELEELTAGLSSSVASRIIEELAQGNQVDVLTVGSRMSGDIDDSELSPWPILLEEELNSIYQEGAFSFTNVTYGGLTTEEIINQDAHQSLEDTEADILILEGFNWNNNLAVVSPSAAEEHLLEIISVVENSNEDVLVMIQPSSPVYETVIYPEQVEDFSSFADEEGFAYIDHWEVWPNVDDEDLLDYVDEERMPNQEGHELWSSYLIQQLAAQ